MNRSLVITLGIFIVAALCGMIIGIGFLYEKIASLESQLTERGLYLIRYGTIEAIDTEKNLMVLRYKSAFGNLDNTLRIRLTPHTIVEEQDSIYAKDVIVRLSEVRRIAIDDLKQGDTVFVRFFGEESIEAVYIKRGAPFLP
jgi:hypothetical protein